MTDEAMYWFQSNVYMSVISYIMSVIDILLFNKKQSRVILMQFNPVSLLWFNILYCKIQKDILNSVCYNMLELLWSILVTFEACEWLTVETSSMSRTTGSMPISFTLIHYTYYVSWHLILVHCMVSTCFITDTNM